MDLDTESGTCEDHEHFGSRYDVLCKHLAAAAILHATRRSRRVAVIATNLASKKCEWCGAVAELVTDDGTLLCEGRAAQRATR